jgi:hypothetical protein
VPKQPLWLCGCCSFAQVRSLLIDPAWLEVKLHCYGVAVVVDDFRSYLQVLTLINCCVVQCCVSYCSTAQCIVHVWRKEVKSVWGKGCSAILHIAVSQTEVQQVSL